jgi:hypothetical protein
LSAMQLDRTELPGEQRWTEGDSAGWAASPSSSERTTIQARGPIAPERNEPSAGSGTRSVRPSSQPRLVPATLRVARRTAPRRSSIDCEDHDDRGDRQHEVGSRHFRRPARTVSGPQSITEPSDDVNHRRSLVDFCILSWVRTNHSGPVAGPAEIGIVRDAAQFAW